MCKIIFLDIDGVLNTYGTPNSSVANWRYYEKELIKNLETLIEQTDAHIVISSSWMEEAIDLLEEAGFKYVNKIIGVTPRQKWHRGEQIKDWLDMHNIDCYVVIDDEMFDICGERCNVIPQEKVVVTDFKKGLTEEKVKEAIIKLKECNGSDDYV